jgi:hypothetical protein
MRIRVALSVSVLTFTVVASTLWAGAQQRQAEDVIKLAAQALGGAIPAGQRRSGAGRSLQFGGEVLHGLFG